MEREIKSQWDLVFPSGPKITQATAVLLKAHGGRLPVRVVMDTLNAAQLVTRAETGIGILDQHYAPLQEGKEG